jgi:hypothetical protein
MLAAPAFMPCSQFVISAEEVMGLRSTQGDNNPFSSATAFNGSVTLPFASASQARRADPPDVSPARKGWDSSTKHCRAPEVRHCEGLSWKCFSTERGSEISGFLSSSHADSLHLQKKQFFREPLEVENGLEKDAAVSCRGCTKKSPAGQRL